MHLYLRKCEGCSPPPATDCASATSLLPGTRAVENQGRTPGTDLGSLSLFRQQGGWVRQGGWWGKAGRMRSGSSLTSTMQPELERAAKLCSFQTQTRTNLSRKCICLSCSMGDGEHKASVYISVYMNISPPLSRQLKWNTLRIAVLKSL